MGRISFRERQRQEREKAIITEAFGLLTTKGYAAMTMDDVAGAVGISKATLYQHFRSKEELTASVGVSLLKNAQERLGALDPQLSAVERLKSVMRGLIEMRCAAERRSGNSYPGGLGATLKPVVSRHPHFQEQYRHFVSTMCGLVDAAKEEGEVRNDIPTRTIVQVLLSLTRDFDYAEMLVAQPMAPETLSEDLASLFLDGVRSKVVVSATR